MKLAVSCAFAAALSLAAAASDSDLYAPVQVDCPSHASTDGFVRKADALSPREADWIKGREPLQKQALIDWLSKSDLQDFDAAAFLGNTTIRVGLAFSGGGYRAMLSGAGQMAATDNRTTNATSKGHMGGLLQAATYVSGLSGGNWLLGSVVLNNFTSVEALQNSKDLWNLEHSIISPGGINIFSTAGRWIAISDAVKAKSSAGFNTSITDIWGRALSYQFFDATRGGINLRYHNVRDYDSFKNHSTFFPIHVADGRRPGTRIISTNSTVFEFNPFELGTWDPSLYSFTDLEYLGSPVSDGKVPQGQKCVNGFDQAGFMLGTSSSLFNQFILRLNGTDVPSVFKKLARDILSTLSQDNDDIALYDPNPFANVSYANSLGSTTVLNLVDGGEDGQNVPLVPLIQPARQVDVVFAFDNSADTKSNTSAGKALGKNWASGKSMIKSYERQFNIQGNNTIFPYVPDVDSFVWGGLALQPTFFGCNRTNLTSLFNESQPENEHYYPPVIVYIANSLHSYYGNTSTFKLSYKTDEVAGLIENGYNTFTQNNGTIDPEFRSCVACAIILREQQRRGVSPSEQCSKCLDRYCWDGTITPANSSVPQRRDGKSNLVAGFNGAKPSEESNSTASGQASGSASASASGKKGKKKNSAAASKPAMGLLAGLFGLFLML